MTRSSWCSSTSSGINESLVKLIPPVIGKLPGATVMQCGGGGGGGGGERLDEVTTER
ncbi:uncharacterized protein PADG_00394 [Paracoccidioides brasiliensis Pb18]|uniref:Uncharacterized protein n=1 Tax=Paracoccidioides brasiliensis (strain Pb18) TaxID=502780 RepID=C1G0K4_PARBD|nr:uncharacterized protein PADG_00394 [Paracoccidioides brasiliensis Pb18]EEH44105.2 hypothetical protein PADG_00394 [Paracoccidioides brasiliensis Pb18]